MGKYAAFDGGPEKTAGARRSPTQAEMSAALSEIAASRRSAGEIATALGDLVGVLWTCAWLEGDLRMELEGDPMGVTLALYTEQGAVRERALPAVTLPIALDELDVALQAAHGRMAPLRMRHHKGKLIFTQSGVAATLPPPDVVVSVESLTPEAAENPHEKETRKQPRYALPKALQSGTHLRNTPDEE
jgi:hypothetical protein